ncbi:MAG: PAS domain S-box protein [Ghiorsea sp.]
MNKKNSNAPQEKPDSYVKISATLKAAELERIIDAATIVLYRLEWLGDAFVPTYVSPSITELFGFEQQEMMMADWWRSHVHPDDLSLVERNQEETLLTEGIKQVYRFANQQGEYRWISDHLKLIKHDGEPDEIIGSWMDITEVKHAESKIQDLAYRNKMILKSSLDGVIITDEQGQVVDVNPAYCEMIGYSKAELLSMNIIQLEAHLTPEQVGEKIQQMEAHGSARFDSKHRCKHGQIVDLDVSTFVMKDVHEKVLIVAFMCDMSQQRENQKALKVSEEKYRSLFQDARDMIHIVGVDGLIQDVNQFELDTLGYTRDEMTGKPITEILHPDSKPLVQHRMGDTFSGTPQGVVEIKLLAKDGRIIPVEVSAVPQYDNQGNIIAMRGVLRDISLRKQKEGLLARREEQLWVLAEAGRVINQTLDELEIGRCLVNLAMKMLQCESGAIGFYQKEKICFREYNKSGETLEIQLDFASGYGVPGHVLATKEMYISSNAPEDEHVTPEIQAMLGFIKLIDIPVLDAKGEVLGCFEMHDRLDGLDFDTQDVEMLQTLAGVVSGALVNAKSLREQQDLTNKLYQSQMQYEEAAEIAKVGHWILNVPDGKQEWSKQTYLINELDSKTFVPTIESAISTMHPDDRAMMQEALENAIQNNSNIDNYYRLKMEDGRIKWVHLCSKNECDEQGHVIRVLGTIQDVSKEREQSEQLRLLEKAIASVNESILITDAKGVIVYVNSAFLLTTGYSTQEAVGKTPSILNSKMQTGIFYEHMWSTLLEGKPWAGRVLDRRKDGTIFPSFLSIATIFDASDEITHFVAVHEDLTSKEAMQKKLNQTQKMEAVATLVGGIAHDFNNILGGLVGNLYLIRMKNIEDVALVARVENMEKSILRASKMIQQMMTFSRTDVTEMRPVDLGSFIKEIHKLTEASVPENIKFRVDTSLGKDCWVDADATQLQQVLLNLISNAKDALENKDVGTISISLDHNQPPYALLGKHLELDHKAGWYRISCVDNGCGISEEDKGHVFEPFFTTKVVGKGTGLGMAMVYGAVESHRGLIDIQAADGGGTEVQIWLPKRIDKVIHLEEESLLHVDGRGKTLLLVDDDQQLRSVLSEILRENGFFVLQAFDGDDAVRMYKENIKKISVVLMDVVMPNKGGVMAAKKIRELTPNMPIIFQTGYGEKTEVAAAAAVPGSQALQKPVHMQKLLKAISTLLRGETGYEGTTHL